MTFAHSSLWAICMCFRQWSDSKQISTKQHCKADCAHLILSSPPPTLTSVTHLSCFNDFTAREHSQCSSFTGLFGQQGRCRSLVSLPWQTAKLRRPERGFERKYLKWCVWCYKKKYVNSLGPPGFLHWVVIYLWTDHNVITHTGNLSCLYWTHSLKLFWTSISTNNHSSFQTCFLMFGVSSLQVFSHQVISRCIGLLSFIAWTNRPSHLWVDGLLLAYI